MHVGFVNFVRLLKQAGSKGRGFSKLAFSDRFLLYTNMGISVLLSGVGDVLEQQYEIYEKEIESWDMVRSRNMSVSGCATGILCHFWYQFLDAKMPGRTISIVAKKVIIDQLTCSPLTITTFFATLAILEGTGISNWEDIKKKAWKLYVAEWVVWPPAQVINFYILPTKYRVLYDNTIALGYDIYTSNVVKRKPHTNIETVE